MEQSQNRQNTTAAAAAAAAVHCRFVGQAVGFITNLVAQLMGEAMADTSRHSDSEWPHTLKLVLTGLL
jgi:hypothetical protein